MKCGHNEPSNENTAYKVKIPENFDQEYSVILDGENSVNLKMNENNYSGNWTMVYDEGFNIDTEEWTFFAFSKYSPAILKNGKFHFQSYCFQTCTGWYANKDASLWGCYYGYKKGAKIGTVFERDTKVQQVVEPKIENKKNLQSSENKKEKKKEFKDEVRFTSNVTYKTHDNSNSKENNNNKDEKFDFSILPELFGLDTNSNSNNSNSNSNVKTEKYNDVVKFNSISFMDLSIKENLQSKLKLNSSFTNHLAYIRRLNKIKKSWSADLSKDFFDKTISQLNKFAGRPKKLSFNDFRFKQIDEESEVLNFGKNFNRKIKRLKEEENIDTFRKKFPKNFDWKKTLREAGSQGNCGSCYAYSTTRMTESRLRIKYGHQQELSVQHNLDCNYYNQGCSGGYPFLLMKFASQFEMIPEDCKPYIEMNGNCEDGCDVSILPYTYKLEKYRYIGGSYGDCSEEAMMEEVYKNGPLVVSFEPDYNFMLYRSGVYHSISEESWLKTGVEKPEWQKVDHSVLLVGWGEDEKTGEKYWLIQNTWGPYWGENGFFKMRRGTDELNVESICEAADPLIVDNMTKKILSADEYKQNKQHNSNNKTNKDENTNENFNLSSNMDNETDRLASSIKDNIENKSKEKNESIFTYLID